MNQHKNVKPTLCLDFDGVCSQYIEWIAADVIPDEPVKGLFEFLAGAIYFFDVHIYSSRSHQEGGIQAMKDWFSHHWKIWSEQCKGDLPCSDILDHLTFPDYKPPAMVTIDDRAFQFNGNWKAPQYAIENLKHFKPWNREHVEHA